MCIVTAVQDRLPRVVIADDHPSVLAAFCRILERGCDVVAAIPTGREAVEAVMRLRPDVLVIDLMLPDVDGVEVCRRVRESASETQVVIVTAFDDRHVEKIARDNGAAAYVVKHSAAQTLPETIHHLCAERR